MLFSEILKDIQKRERSGRGLQPAFDRIVEGKIDKSHCPYVEEEYTEREKLLEENQKGKICHFEGMKGKSPCTRSHYTCAYYW